MFPYEYVKSIHDQKAAKFMAERDKVQMASLARAGQPSALRRRVEEIVESLRNFGQTVGGQGRYA